MSDFWAMGGYALYIWPVYILAFILFVFFFCHAWSRLKKSQTDLDLLEKLDGNKEDHI